MKLYDLESTVDMHGYDDVYVIIKTHPSITQNKYTREERLKEWETEGQYKMYSWPFVMDNRECKIHRVYAEKIIDKNNLYIIVRMEDGENQVYLSDFLNLNPSMPIIILNGNKSDEVLFQGLVPTNEIVDKYGDCVVESYKIEDREFEDDYGDTTIRPTMIIAAIRGGLNTHTEKKPDTHTEENPEPALYLSTLLKTLPEKMEVALDIDVIDDLIESEADNSIIMETYGNYLVESVFPQNDRLIISITNKK